MKPPWNHHETTMKRPYLPGDFCSRTVRRRAEAVLLMATQFQRLGRSTTGFMENTMVYLGKAVVYGKPVIYGLWFMENHWFMEHYFPVSRKNNDEAAEKDDRRLMNDEKAFLLRIPSLLDKTIELKHHLFHFKKDHDRLRIWQSIHQSVDIQTNIVYLSTCWDLAKYGYPHVPPLFINWLMVFPFQTNHLGRLHWWKPFQFLQIMLGVQPWIFKHGAPQGDHSTSWLD